MMSRVNVITKAAACFGLSALTLSGVSHAEIVDVKWDAAGKFERAQSVAPGKFVEICENLPKDSIVTWKFKATAPLNFNIHFHQGKDVAFPEQQDGVSERQGTLVTPSSEDYCWMWTNKGDAASNIRVLLAKATTKR